MSNELPMYDPEAKCPKCGRGDILDEWLPALAGRWCLGRWDPPKPERHSCLCEYCGYGWEMRCLDAADQAGPPKAPGKIGQRATLVELLAASMHAEWANWTHHMLSNYDAEHRERWWRQVASQYVELSDEEQESDRRVARRIIGDIDAWLAKEDPTRDAFVEAALAWTEPMPNWTDDREAWLEAHSQFLTAARAYREAHNEEAT